MQLRDDAGQQLNAEYSVVPDGSQLALILESSGGRTRTGAARNADYQTALFHLLARLKERDAVLVGALVDSRVTRGLPEPQRTLVDSPVRLAGKLVAEVQQRLTSPQGRIGQREGATKAGNQSKRIRLRLDVPGYTAAEPHRLAVDLADPAPSVRDRESPTPDELIAMFSPSAGVGPADSTSPAENVGIGPAGMPPPEAAPDAGQTAAMSAEEPVTDRRAGSGSGPGRLSDAVLKEAIKRHAEQYATDDYVRDEYAVQNVGDTESYDLHAVKGTETLHIEVKGSSGTAGAVRLTSNEVRHAGRAATHLFVVDQIRWTRDSDGTVHTSGGRARRWTAWLPAPENLTPTQYEYRLPPGGEAR